MKIVKVTDGYFTFTDEATEQIVKKKGVAYVWSGVPSSDAAANIIESGKMLSSTSRLKRGLISAGGSSVEADIKSGGADNVFSRIAMKVNIGNERFASSYAHGKYQFLFDKGVLKRSDWYAYTDDKFGTTVASDFLRRKSMSELFDNLNRSYNHSNEVMFRKSLSLDSLTEIRCPRAVEKQDLIDALAQRGITKVNGINLDNFIKVGKEL